MQQHELVLKLIEYFNDTYGLSIDENLRPTAEHKLLEKMLSVEITDFDQLVSDKKQIPLLGELLDVFLVKHTEFFRDREQFETLTKIVLPDLTGRVSHDHYHDLRIWSAGCASGEEPYSILITALEFFQDKYWEIQCGILATDVSQEGILAASKGAYKKDNLLTRDLSVVKKYADLQNDSEFVFKERIKSEITVREFNLNSEVYPFKKRFHVVFCRNVLIYFNTNRRDFTVKRILNSMESGGYLFLGDAERLDIAKYPVINVGAGVYQKIDFCD